MNMQFFEVFETLKVAKELQDMFEDTVIERVAASRINQEVKIYIMSTHLISRKLVKKMQYQIKKQLFADTSNEVRLCDRYELSAQYTPDKLMDAYYESLLEEMKDSSILEYNLFKMADYKVEGDTIEIEMEDNFVAKNKSSNMKRILEDNFSNRFGYAINIKFNYVDPPEKDEEDIKEIYAKAMRKHHMSHDEDGDVYIAASDESGHLMKESDNTSISVGSTKGNAQEVPKAESKDKSADTRGAKTEKTKYNTYKKLPQDPDIIYGKSFEGEAIAISEIQDEVGEVVVRGRVNKFETRELRNEKTIITFAVTDFTDTISAKIFVKNEQVADIASVLKNGIFIKMKGMALMDKYDREISISSIVGIKTIPDFTTSRVDNAPVKRVELHAHTMMSDMDAVVDAKTLIKRAMAWGHNSIAITDHGVVQAFTEANHVVEKSDFKVIYGVEAYLVDDLKDIVENGKGQTLDAPSVVF
ncbi:PolC-type DNA polymerase III N-terminal domain-containing protein, partial [Anaerosporobacter sp.]|uniref:PolC-type DNA polymerase III N-terminal domain-containing protein n=1 Tax=Anaerosporobacter sp. TaxID=1872529 RepID=UPI00289A849A